MENLDKLVERLYSETDFSRSVATSVAGLVGLVIYLLLQDWVIAAFAAIIVFPVIRLASSRIHERRQRSEKRRAEQEEADESYSRLSEHEQAVVQAFVEAGGAVLTWSQMNALELRGSAVESLIHREFLNTSMTADGMRETFVLDQALFEAGIARARKANP